MFDIGRVDYEDDGGGIGVVVLLVGVDIGLIIEILCKVV